MSPPSRRAAKRWRDRAETLAALSLCPSGWLILDRYWRSQAGEVNPVARLGRLIAYIEVQAWNTASGAFEAVSARQWARIARAVSNFLAQHPKFANLDVRFDVLVVTPGH